MTGCGQRTFLFPTSHTGPIGLLAYCQFKVRTGIVQHGQWESLDNTVRVETIPMERKGPTNL